MSTTGVRLARAPPLQEECTHPKHSAHTRWNESPPGAGGNSAKARRSEVSEMYPRKADMSPVGERDTHIDSLGARTSPISSQAPMPGFSTQ